MAGESGSVPRCLRCLLVSQVSLSQNRCNIDSFHFPPSYKVFSKGFIFNIVIYVYVCLCGECHMCKSGLRSQKRAPDSQELKLQEVVSCLLWVLRTILVLWKSSKSP